MRPDDYVSAIHLALAASAVVASYTVVRQRISSQQGFVHIRAILNNGDFLESTEFFVAGANDIECVDYRHQWMDGERATLRKRWDSKPHFPHLPNFPHHCHDGGETNVVPSEPLSMMDLLKLLERELLPAP